MLDTVSKIRNSFGTLKNAERRVAECILKDPQAVISITITELAEKAGVSDPTVVRFCQKMGLKGYMELRLNLARDLPPPVYVYETIKDDDSPIQILEKMINTHQEGLREALNRIDIRKFEAAVDMLIAAKKIDFYGFCGSGLVAEEARHKFFRLGIQCNTYKDAHLHLIGASLLNSECVAVAISITGSAFDLIETVKTAKKVEAKMIGIVGRKKTPLDRYCDLVFSMQCRESVPWIYDFSTRFAQITLLDALFVAVSNKKNGATKSDFDKIQRTLLNKNY